MNRMKQYLPFLSVILLIAVMTEAPVAEVQK